MRGHSVDTSPPLYALLYPCTLTCALRRSQVYPLLICLGCGAALGLAQLVRYMAYCPDVKFDRQKRKAEIPSDEEAAVSWCGRDRFEVGAADSWPWIVAHTPPPFPRVHSAIPAPDPPPGRAG